MAPLTRRAAKALDTPSGETTSPASEIIESPVKRSKQSTPTEDAKEVKEDGVERAEVATRSPRKLQVWTKASATPSKEKISPIDVQIPSSVLKTPGSAFRSLRSRIQDTESNDEGNITVLSASEQLEEEANQKLESQSRLRQMESPLASTPLAKASPPTGTESFETAQESPDLESGTQTPTPTQPPSQKKSQAEPYLVDSEPEGEATPRPAVAKSTHVVFGDDDDVDKFVAAAAENTRNEPEPSRDEKEADEEEEESDDEAPEAVSTAAAARETMKSARAAIEAAEKLAASTKRKRQARDNLLKQQAETRKRTRETEPSERKEEGESPDGEPSRNAKRQRRSKKLPEMLPAEFLADSSEDEDEDDEATLKKIVKQPRKITFDTAMEALSIEGMRPRDEIVGSTRYRVLAEKGDQLLAPKASKTSRKAKAELLRRGRQRVEPNKKRGFFVRR